MGINNFPVDISTLSEAMKLKLSFPDNGYEFDRNRAFELIKKFGPDHVYTLINWDIGDWHTTLEFADIPGHYNSVQFAKVEE